MIDRSNAVVFDPAVADPGPTNCVGRCLHAGLAVSQDEGASWRFTESPTGSRVDNFIYADPSTNRLFWIPFSDATPTLDVRISDDDGRSWRDSSACCGSAENPHIVAALPRTSHPAGYPNVLYLCSNTSYLGGLESATGARMCSRSLDGGATWSLLGPIFSKPLPQHSQCLPRGEVFGAVDDHYPQAAPDGSLYLLVRCGGSAPETGDNEFLARSTDEGTTWPIVHPIPLPAVSPNDLDTLRVDTAGHLYLVRTDATTHRPILRVSTDGGASWGGDVDLAAPGVVVGHPASEAPGVFISPQLWDVAVRGPGRVAVAYYARPAGQSRWDAYLTETWDALDAHPLLWSARLNLDNVDLTDALTDTIGNDYMGVTIGPDDTPWAAFYHSTGFAGRLTRAAATSPGTAPLSGGLTQNQTSRSAGQLPATGGPRLYLIPALVGLVVAISLRSLRRFGTRR